MKSYATPKSCDEAEKDTDSGQDEGAHVNARVRCKAECRRIAPHVEKEAKEAADDESCTKDLQTGPIYEWLSLKK